MPFVSYAQNFEDVLLWRALKGVTRGTWIDVGANHPTTGSVTRAFYERGWRGLNIEPVPADYELLVAERPEDINAQVAVGDVPGTLPLFEFGVPGLATLSENISARHQAAGLPVARREVRVVPLRELCEQYLAGREVHFLKVDVEGSEGSVLRSMNFQRWRPWVLVIEATLPNTEIPSHAEWEPALLEQGYVFCFFDGLSRYYVAREKEAELRPALSRPANVFDDFVLASQVAEREELARLRAELDQQQDLLRQFSETGSAVALKRALDARIEGLEAQLAAAREAWTVSQASVEAARREAAALKAELFELQRDPYFRTGVALRDLARRIRRQ